MIRILYIENNESDIKLLIDSFKHYRIVNPVDVARTAKEAFEKIEVDKPDLIILSLNLPDMDGVAVLKTLKLSIGTSNIPIAVLSENKYRIQECLWNGASCFCGKPLDLFEIVKIFQSDKNIEWEAIKRV